MLVVLGCVNGLLYPMYGTAKRRYKVPPDGRLRDNASRGNDRRPERAGRANSEDLPEWVERYRAWIGQAAGIVFCIALAAPILFGLIEGTKAKSNNLRENERLLSETINRGVPSTAQIDYRRESTGTVDSGPVTT
jgi:hypothetical protein